MTRPRAPRKPRNGRARPPNSSPDDLPTTEGGLPTPTSEIDGNQAIENVEAAVAVVENDDLGNRYESEGEAESNEMSGEESSDDAGLGDEGTDENVEENGEENTDEGEPAPGAPTENGETRPVIGQAPRGNGPHPRHQRNRNGQNQNQNQGGPNQPPLQRGQRREPAAEKSLERRCVRQFPRIALARGRQYFNDGRVADPVWSDKNCAVEIKGTGGAYHIGFDFSNATEARKLPATCDCPAYARGVLCKHLWAALLQIDKASPEGSIPDSGPLKLVHAQPHPPREQNGHQNQNQNQPHGQNQNPRHGRNQQQQPQGRGHFPKPVAFRAPAAPGSWVERLNQLQGISNRPGTLISTSSAAFFVIAAAETSTTGKLILDLWTRNRAAGGHFGPLRPNRVSSGDFSHYEQTVDQEVLALLTKSGDPQVFAPFGRGSGNISSRFTVDPIFESHLVPVLATAGKLFLSRAPNGTPDSAERPLRLDRTKTWDLELRITESGSEHYKLDGIYRSGTESLPLQSPLAILRNGFMIFGDRIARFTEPGHAPWAIQLRARNEFLVPRAEGETLLTRILLDPASPKTTWPAEMGWTLTKVEPKPIGVFRPLGNDPTLGRMTLTVSFDYDGKVIPLSETEMTIVDVATKRVLQRMPEYEEKMLLQALDIMRDPEGTGSVLYGDLHRAANELARSGWSIHFENQKLHIADSFSMDVTSNTDWFDLKIDAGFGDLSVDRTELLAALESKSGLVKLSDGSLGMLPPDWLARYAPVAQLGSQSAEQNADGTYRFSRSQGLMLNAVLAEDDKLKADSGFMAFRERVKQFSGVALVKAPAGFKGELRDYQKEGLTWLSFLAEFENGGILADDMGLGKTIQILAFLIDRKKKTKLPSLVVAPKSLAFNWMDEAAKFAPGLKVVRYSGHDRVKLLKEMESADLVVTTYGTIRTDIEKLEEFEFDVAIIDEAQAIKNAGSQSAQAVKRIRARHRLALTGTPIENSINDLLSILEFTNPGLLHRSKDKDVSKDTQSVLARMLKPFMLRRTKEKVLKELPDKSEQVLYCEMSASERQFYNAIRDKYRNSLAEKVASEGLGKSKMHVLEALLRLRQAACHGGLIDPKRKFEPSAKLQQLLNHIQEVISEGHKVLVFSQFTSLLSLVKTQLDDEKIAYEYLDGQTDDRKAPVERFQTDPKVPVFLISLKAGGTGLNLTAADYVFILDPWWNPAVEAQAIGRAHRMGQSQKVFAYRMIAKGTVEEKILELQQTKKDLAESLISEDGDFMKKLSREDLEHLLT
jgi:superfamily II DNA or RNA helicase